VRIVAPFRPFPPENELHQELSDFDWNEAIRMLFHSVAIACRCEAHVITDVDTHLPLPALKYATTHRRLMLWNIEVCLRYLESDDFDQDTVMLDADQLVYHDLSKFFIPGVDLAVLVRPTLKHRDSWKKVLNGVQFWSYRGKARLVHFYRQALEIAEALPEDLQRWGGDTQALRQLLEPIELGTLQQRAGLTVQMLDYAQVLEALCETQIKWLGEGRMPISSRAVLDFRWRRKTFMKRVYEATVLSLPTAVGR